MNKIRKLVIIIMLSCITLSQAGCWDQKIYEKIGFILQLGLELDENGKVRYTAVIPVILPEATEKSEVITTTITHMREGRDKIRQVSGKSVEGGKLQQILFSEDLAAKGINEFLEIFLRGPENTLLADVAVVEGSPYELMKFSSNFKDKPRPTFYVNALLESAQRNSSAPLTRISDFCILTNSRTIDPVAPLFKYNSKEIQIAGAALFSGDKMAGKINTQDMALLSGLMGKKMNITYIYQGQYSKKSQNDLKSGASISMRIKKRKVNISFEGDTPVISIKQDFKANLVEYSGELKLENPEEKKKFEEAVAQSIDKECIRLLNYLAQIGADPIGFGEILRSRHHEYWRSVKWKDAYKDITFNVETKLKIEFYGAVSNP